MVEEITRYGADVVVLDPPELRERGAGTRCAGWPLRSPSRDAGAGARDDRAGVGHVMTSQAQVRRLLALVPYLREHDGAPLTEVAAAFGISPVTLRADLDVLWMCGMPGLTPGDLIDIDMDAVDGEGVIHLSNADYLPRPLRLSADEALALVLALRTLRGIAGPGKRAADRLRAGASSRRWPAARPTGEQAAVLVHGGPGRDPGPGERRPAARQAARPHLRRGHPGRDHPPRRWTRCGSSSSTGTATWRHGATPPRRCAPSGSTGSPPCEVTDRRRRAEHDVALRDLAGGWFDALRPTPRWSPSTCARQAAWVAEYYPTEQVAPWPTTAASSSPCRSPTPPGCGVWCCDWAARPGCWPRPAPGDSAAEAAQEALDQYAALDLMNG